MKKLKNIKKSIGHRNLVLSIVALILTLLTAVSVSYSWIEEVSNVKLDTNENAQQSPLHIKEKKLNAQVNVNETKKNSHIDLNDYFYEAGDMHLSGCYSDGNDFYFPKSGNESNGYRKGTKDDANVNYISTTFKVKSEGAPTAYWFEYKDNNATSNPFTFAKDYTGATDPNTGEKTTDPNTGLKSNQNHSSTSALTNYLRASITVNGSTTVYAFNSDGAFKYIDNGTLTNAPASIQSGGTDTRVKRAVKNYMYYNEGFSNVSTSNPASTLGNWKKSENTNTSTKPNQGTGQNLDGNILFTIPKDKTETVTLKLWLQADAPVTSVDLTNINLQITSSWVKSRRIYIRDMTVNEYDSGLNNNQTGAKWLTTDSNAKLFLALYDNDTPSLRTHYPIVKSGSIYYVDIDTSASGIQDVPAVYNGAKCAIYRCNQSWNSGNDHSGDGDINYWDKWETTLPNTFHSETFSIYSHKYGNWDTEDATSIKFIDSVKMIDLNKTPKVYLWDSSSEYDATNVNGKIVKNKDWPGEEMTRLADAEQVGNLNLKLFNIFYSSAYNRAVFNDGEYNTNVNGGRNQLQTQDVWLSNNGTSYVKDYFDFATLKWYTAAELSNVRYTNTVLVNNFNTNDSNQAHIRMVYYTDGTNGTNDHYFMCKAFIKSAGDYFFKIWDHDANTHYGRPSNWNQWALGHGDSTRNIGSSNAQGDLIWIYVSDTDIANSGNGIFRFYYDKDSHYFKWESGEN